MVQAEGLIPPSRTEKGSLLTERLELFSGSQAPALLQKVAHVAQERQLAPGLPPDRVLQHRGHGGPLLRVLEERHQAFTRPSQQFRKHTRRAILASLRRTSVIYRRLMLDASERGARLTETGKKIHQAWRSAGQHKKARNYLLFLWGKLYNGELAKRHGHAPTDA